MWPNLICSARKSQNPSSSWFLKRQEGKGVAANTETSHCLPTVSYIGTDIVFFTTAVAECIQCINAGLSLGAPDSCCVHFALFNDACWGDSGIPPLTSALSGPEPVSAVSMATGDTQPQWLETNECIMLP